MWCRTILTAVAISYVICMLLLSGLQKEDLDANTLEKLGRHNVNIQDLNNDQLRQECLLSSYPLKGNDTQQVTTDGPSEVLRMSTTSKSIVSDDNVFPKQEMGTSNDSKNDSLAKNEIKINKTEVIKEKNNYLGNAKNIEENKDLQIQYNVQNQPDLESVMNFWTKLTHYTKTVVTKVPTTPASPDISEKNVTTTVEIETRNNGYVHSREMEYISRILAEYLASQTIPTTTEKVTPKNTFINYVPRRFGDMLKNPTDNETNPEFPTTTSAQPINEIIGLNNFTHDDVQDNKLMYNYMTDETKIMPTNITNDNNQQIQSVQDTPYNQILKFKTNNNYESKSVKKHNPIRFIDNLLNTQNNFNIDEIPLPFVETTTNMTSLLTSDNNERQDKTESYDQYSFIQYMNDVNKNTTKNVEQNQNVVMNNDQLTSAPVDVARWEPVRGYKMINKQFKVVPIDNKDSDQTQNLEINNPVVGKNSEQAETFGIYERFKTLRSNINNSEQRNSFDDNIPTDINKSEQTRIVNIKKKIRPADFKKAEQNSFEKENDQSAPILPARKKSKQNKMMRAGNNKIKVTRTELNKVQQTQNMESNDNQFESMPAGKHISEQNLIYKMKNEQLEEPEAKRNNKQNAKINHFQIMPLVLKKSEKHPVSRKPIRTIPVKETKENQSYVVNTEQPTPAYIKDTKLNGNVRTKIYEPQAIPANIIREIAEKVKQIVLRDIEKEVTTRTGRPDLSTSSTVAPTPVHLTPKTTGTTSEKPSTLQKEITEANQVLKKLMEIFSEFKAMKDTAKLTSQMPPNTKPLNDVTTTQLPKFPIQKYPASMFNPQYLMKTPIDFKLIEGNPYAPKMMPVPITFAVNMPPNQISQYLPQNLQQKGDPQGAITIQTNSVEVAPLAIQISKPLKLINQHIIVTTKRSVDKQKIDQDRDSKQRLEQKFNGRPVEVVNNREKVKIFSDLTKKVPFEETFKKREYNDRYAYKSRFNKDREKPWYNNDYNENSPYVENLNHRGGYPDSSNYPEIGNPRYSYSDGYSYAGGLGRPRGYNAQSGMINRPRHQSGSYSYPEQNRPPPRYEATKFHERLERIENWPRNNWKDIRNCCNEISSRQQVPLSKIKKRTRFDDTHFTNFLKSQQKVTDMLEKILANNIKNSGPHSVETP